MNGSEILNYILADFEFNQAFDFTSNSRATSNPRCPCEIIQIGAIRLDRMFNMTDELNIYVKPTVYRRMHPYVSKLTGITHSILNRAGTFPKAYEKLEQFCDKDSIFLFWGPDDMKELYRNMLYYDIDPCKMTKKYVNLQKAASVYLKNSGSVGLRGVVEYFGIPIDRPFHDAVNDAYYVGKILPLIYSEEHFVVQEVCIDELIEQEAKRMSRAAAAAAMPTANRRNRR